MAKKAQTAEPTKREVLAKAPDKRKRRKTPVTKGKTGLTRVPPDMVDPEFLSESDMFKRELFAQAYVAKGTLAAAAEAAGYTGNNQTLRVTGYRLYNEPWVKNRIQQIKTDLLDELQITQRGILAELKRIGFADIRKIVDEYGELLPLNQIPEATARAISGYKVTRKTFGEDGESIEKEVKFENKSNALKDLGKHMGLWGKEEDRGPGINAEDFARALGEGIARVIAGKRTINHES